MSESLAEVVQVVLVDVENMVKQRLARPSGA
jgi:hypothetical protein